MSKTGSANGSFFGNFIYDRLLQRRSHFLHDLSRTVAGYGLASQDAVNGGTEDDL